MDVVLYSTEWCVKCKDLKKALVNKNIDYAEVTDENAIMAAGYDFVPVLIVDGEAMQFDEAMKWVGEQ